MPTPPENIPKDLGSVGRLGHGVPDDATLTWVTLSISEFARIVGSGPESLSLGRSQSANTRFPAWTWQHANREYFAVYRRDRGAGGYTFWYILGRLPTGYL